MWIENSRYVFFCLAALNFNCVSTFFTANETKKKADGKGGHHFNEYKDTSEKFQWLPSEVSISKDGKAKFESYINNLHPEQHKEL
jgi:hypothetical protein